MNDNLDNIAKTLQGMRQDLEQCMQNLHVLSPGEQAFVPEANARIKRPPLAAEIDCDLTFSGRTIPLTLSVYGRFTPAMKGGHEPGERPYEPDTPAGFDVWSVEIGETDILGEIGQKGEDEVVAYIMENRE